MDTTKSARFSLKSFACFLITPFILASLLYIDLSKNNIQRQFLTGKQAVSIQDDTAEGPIPIEAVLTYQNPTYTLTQPNANFISLHFAEINLPDGDYVTLADQNGNVYCSYPDVDILLPGEGAGWASLVFGDTITLSLHINSGLPEEEYTGYQVYADQYYFSGHEGAEAEDEPVTEAIVNTDEKENVECYSGDSDYYPYQSPVALLYNTSSHKVCTAFIVGQDGYVLTNEHCVTDADELSTVELWFNYQYTTCGGGTLDSLTKVLASNLSFIQDSPVSGGYDYALLHITDTSAIDSFGYLWLDVSTPEDDERISIPQHPSGAPKQFAVYDTEQVSGYCEVETGIYNSTESMYTCDTEGGSSGSPVISYETNEVFILHHATNGLAYPFTANFGIRIEEFWSEIDDFIRPRTVTHLVYPSLGASPINDTTPEYLFLEPTMADEIRLWVAHNTEGVIVNEWLDRSVVCAGPGSCSYEPSEVHPYGEYTVMFQTRNTAGTSDWSEEFYYNMGESPTLPTIVSPIGTENLIRPIYSWDGGHWVNEYNIFVSHAAVGTMINEWVDDLDVCTAYDCTWQSDVHLRTGNHSWWLRSRSGHGTTSWTSPEVFKIWNTTAPTGSVTKVYPEADDSFAFNEFTFIWEENTRASWYKIFMTDSIGKLYNQYHRAAEICYGSNCSLPHSVYAPLLFAPRGLSELPTDTWIHWQVMPVNVAGNGSWTGYTKFWMYSP